MGMIPSPHRFSHRDPHQRSQTRQPPSIKKITPNQAKIKVQTAGEGTGGIIPIIKIILITVQTRGTGTDNHHQSKKSHPIKRKSQFRQQATGHHPHHSVRQQTAGEGTGGIIPIIKIIKITVQTNSVRQQASGSPPSQFRQRAGRCLIPIIEIILITVQTRSADTDNEGDFLEISQKVACSCVARFCVHWYDVCVT